MDGLLTTRDASKLVEPRGTTFADLVLLVAGFAVFIVAPWFGFQPSKVPWLSSHRDVDWFYTISGTLVEGSERLCFLLAIVAFARRVRFGGLARPGEFLLAFVALNLLLTPRAGSMWVLAAQSRAALYVAVIVLCLAAPAIVAWRRSLPGPFLAALISIVFVSLIFINDGFGEFVDWLIDAPAWPDDWRQIVLQFGLEPLWGFPGSLLFVGPYAAALWNCGEVRRRWSWIEWSGVMLATVWFLCEQVHYFTSALLSDPLWYYMACIAEGWFFKLAAFILSVKLARRLEPGWCRWIARA